MRDSSSKYPKINMIQKPFTLTTKDVIKQLKSDVVYGLNKKEVQRRQVQYGKNDIRIFIFGAVGR